MKILLNLVKKNILVNKKLFLAIILGISLSVSLIFTIFNVKENLNKSIREITFKNNGAYHYKIIDVDKSKIDYILNNKLVKDYYYLYVDKNNPDVYHIDNKYIYKKIIKVVKGKLEFDKYLYSENKMLLNIKDASGYFSGYMPYVKFTKIKDYSKVNLYVELKNYKNTKEFENIIKNTKYEKNEGIYDYYDGKNDNMKVLNILSYFAIAIVIIASFVIINNSFSISFAEKIKQIGILSSVGATKKQLNTFLKLECFIIGFIGSVLGIIIGITASLILGNYLQNAVKILTDNVMILPNEIHLLSFIVSIILIFVTIYFVIIKLSYKYSKVTIIESIRNKDYVKLKDKEFDKKIKNPSLFLAKKNLKVSKKKYRTTVISITISVILFITMNTFIGYYMQQYGKYEKSYDVIINIFNKNNSLNYDEYVNKYKSLLKNTEYDYASIVQEKEIINVLPDKYFKYVSKDLNKIVTTKEILDNKKINSKVKSILRKAKKTPCISESNFKSNMNKYKLMNINFGYVKTKDNKETKYFEKALDNKEKMFDNINIIDVTRISQNFKLLAEISQILIYGFIIVLSLIGVTNIFNVVSSNMKLRKSDFATLKSIGITNKEFNKMIVYESMIYSLKSLIIGIVISLGISYLMYKAISDQLSKADKVFYQLPYQGIIISILVVFVIILVTMRYSIKKIDEDNIIETIRNENI
jgi:ABC-type transport system, involved in lipoprotein release, permease component